LPYCLPCWTDKKLSDARYTFQERKKRKPKTQNGQQDSKVRKSPSSSFSSSSFDEEYQPITTFERRPPQAFGSPEGFTTDSPVENAAMDISSKKNAAASSKYEDESDESVINDTEVTVNKSLCTSCQSPCLLTHCKDCWNLRKQWLPYRKRKPGKFLLVFKAQWRRRLTTNDRQLFKQKFHKSWAVSLRQKKCGKLQKDLGCSEESVSETFSVSQEILTAE